MKATIGALYSIRESMAEVLETVMPPKDGRILRKLHRAIATEIEDVEPIRTKLLERYSKGMDEKGQHYILPKPGDDDFAEFNKEFYVELMGTVVDVPYEKIDVDALDDFFERKDIDVKQKVVMQIEDFNRQVDFEEQEAKKKKEEAEEEKKDE